MKKIGVVGLGLSNPYFYAPILAEMGARVCYVWDYTRENAQDYARKFDCAVVEHLEDYPDVDGVLIDARNADHCAFARSFIKRNIPVFIEKPMSHSPKEALAFLDEFPDAKFFSCSPLRVANSYVQMKQDILRNNDELLLCKVSVFHTMEFFLSNPVKRWHDNEREGGGMLVDIGIHAIELLNLFMPKTPLKVSYLQTKSHYTQAECGDNHVITIEYEDHSIGIVSLLCATQRLDYSVEAYSATREYINTVDQRYFMPDKWDADNAYGGFLETMAAFLKMIETGVSPISPEETRRNFTLIEQILQAKQ